MSREHFWNRITYLFYVIRQAHIVNELIRYSCINLIYALTWMLQTLVLQQFFDAVQEVGSGIQERRFLIVMLVAMGFSYLAYHVMDGISNCYCEVLALKMSQGLHRMLFMRVKTINAVDFEDAGRLNQIEKAKNGAMFFSGVVFTIVDILTYYVPYFIFMGWYLFTQNAILAVSVVVAFVPTALSRLSSSFLFKDLEEKVAPLRRQADYYEKCISGREYIKETRIWGAEEIFEKKYQVVQEKKNKLWMRAIIKQNTIQIMLHIITACCYGMIIWLLFVSVMHGEITLGVFAAVLATIGNLFRFMNKMVSERLGWMTENIGSVNNFINFVIEKAEKSEYKRTPGSELVLDNVSFCYPQAEEQAISGIHLRIKDGETIALVGENGSGKTTLARVLAGLYEPTEGRIEYGGKLLKEYSPEGISAVFQKFNRYHMTLRDNLSIGSQLISDDEKLRAIGKEVDLSFEELQDNIGLNSMLGREFGGTDVSGGQWQRIAIGRGRYRDHNMIILDEPTASIDPMEESEIYKKFAQSCEGKTVILITHRLGAVKLADRIILLSKGKIVEDGTWKNLMETGGLFKEMYEEQQQWYRG